MGETIRETNSWAAEEEVTAGGWGQLWPLFQAATKKSKRVVSTVALPLFLAAATAAAAVAAAVAAAAIAIAVAAAVAVAAVVAVAAAAAAAVAAAAATVGRTPLLHF